MILYLVISTHFKTISQIGSSPHVGVKIKNDWNHHLVLIMFHEELLLSLVSKTCERWGQLNKRLLMNHCLCLELQTISFKWMVKEPSPNVQICSHHPIETTFDEMDVSKNFPTYPWNIPQTPNQHFMKEFLSFGGLERPGVCETRVCWGSLRMFRVFWWII